MTKEVVALDIDDVALKHVEGFIAWSNNLWGTNLAEADYREEWHEIWAISLEEAEERKRMFFTDEVMGSFEVIEEAGESMTALSAVKTLVGVTSRRESLKAVTESALDLMAPGAIDRVVFATFFRDGQKISRSKADICKELGASHLVDDQLKHCLAVARIDIGGVLFGEYPWQDPNPVLPDGVVRARDWREVRALFGVEL